MLILHYLYHIQFHLVEDLSHGSRLLLSHSYSLSNLLRLKSDQKQQALRLHD
jgi:hypothetical protein